MKFIVDAQLPKTLSDLLKEKGLDSIHTLELPNRNETKDRQIVEVATAQGRIIITKDNDFLESYLVKGEPKKLILVRTGNIVNRELLHLFEVNLVIILKMARRSNLIEVTSTSIIEHK